MGLLKKVFNKKFIGILLAVVILFNVISPDIVTPKSYAIDLGGILLFPLTFLVSILADAAIAVVSTVAGMTGAEDDRVFIDNIVYNEIDIFNVNVFDDSKMSSGAALGDMLGSIQKWYYITRTIAIAASFVILVYVGIKIFISTAAGDKAKYKSLLKDWALSLLLIFAMHFLMAGILYAADALTETIANIARAASGGAARPDLYKVIHAEAMKANTNSILYAIMLWVMLVVTFAFIIIYAKRAIMIAFLTVFAPLVALSYSIDKIKDGQSQILDKWMKEYIYTALMMPLDAILYSIIADSLVVCLGDGGNFIFGLALIIGYLPLRGWFNEFLGTDKAGHGMAGVAAGAAVGNAIANITKTNNKSSNKKSSNTSNESVSDGGSNGSVAGGGGRNHEIATKASANPLLNGGADKERVSSPTSAAVASASSSSQGELTAAQQAVQRRAQNRIQSSPKDVALGAVKGVGNIYGKGLGMVAGATAGLAMTALKGDVGAGLLTGIGTTKLANSGNAGGLGGKITGKAQSVGSKAASAAITAKDTVNYMRDRAMTGGIVNAMAEHGSIQDVDDDEQTRATQWAIENTSDERFEELFEQVERGDITEQEMDDIMFREAIQANKGEIKQNLADQRMETRVNRKEQYKANADKAGRAVLAEGYSQELANDTRKNARKRGKSDFKEQNRADNEAMRAKKNEIKARGNTGKK